MAAAAELAATQRLLWRLIAAPEGVRKGLAALSEPSGGPPPDLGTVIRGDERMDAVERLDIYANMYFYRLRDALAEDFPKVAAVVGGIAFHNLVTDYLLAHPPRSWTLRDLGTEVPGFLAAHELSGERPFLGDLAALEWARIEVFDETDASPLTRQHLSGFGAEEIGRQRLRLVPACRLLDHRWPVAPVWRQVEERAGAARTVGADAAAAGGTVCALEEAPMPIDGPAAGRTHLLVWRRRHAVEHRSLGRPEAACLRALQRGTTLPALCDRLIAADPALDASAGAGPPERATRRMAELLDRWLSDGILTTG